MKTLWKALPILLIGWGPSCGPQTSDPFRGFSVALPQTTLTLHTGKTITIPQDLKGHWTLVGWIYTSCPDVCPITSQQYRLIRDSLRAHGYGPDRIRLLILSFDPERDTLARLQEYARHFEADDMLLFARTSPAATQRLASIFRFSYRKLMPKTEGMSMEHKGHQGYYFAHDVKSYLVNPKGEVVGVYEGNMADPAPPEVLLPALLRRLKE